MSSKFKETETEKAINRNLQSLAVEWAEENGIEALVEKLDLLPIGGYIFLQRRDHSMGELYRACEMLGVSVELIYRAFGSALLPKREL